MRVRLCTEENEKTRLEIGDYIAYDKKNGAMICLRRHYFGGHRNLGEDIKIWQVYLGKVNSITLPAIIELVSAATGLSFEISGNYPGYDQVFEAVR